ncbi:hypothetical protein Dimus_012294 [Dionaea muscipula]
MEISSATSSLPSFPKNLYSHLLPSSKPSTFLVGRGISSLKATSGNCLALNRTRPRRRDAGRKGLSCNCLFGLGVPELAVIAGVAVLVFGPKKLPEVGRSIGKTVKSFQQAAKEFESELKKDPGTLGDAVDTKPAAVSEQEKDDIKVSASNET